jgi:hypothetical protein
MVGVFDSFGTVNKKKSYDFFIMGEWSKVIWAGVWVWDRKAK